MELTHRIGGNIFGMLGFLVSLPLVFWWKPGLEQFSFPENVPWIPSIGARYHLGIDGISLLLVMLTTFLGMIAILSSWSAIHQRTKDRKSTRLNSSHGYISYAVFCLKKK